MPVLRFSPQKILYLMKCLLVVRVSFVSFSLLVSVFRLCNVLRGVAQDMQEWQELGTGFQGVFVVIYRLHNNE